MKRDGASKSIWQSAKADYNTAILNRSTEYDVVIVGAGVTGVTPHSYCNRRENRAYWQKQPMPVLALPAELRPT